MKRRLSAILLLFAFTGCGGVQEASNDAPGAVTDTGPVPLAAETSYSTVEALAADLREIGIDCVPDGDSESGGCDVTGGRLSISIESEAVSADRIAVLRKDGCGADGFGAFLPDARFLTGAGWMLLDSGSGGAMREVESITGRAAEALC